MKWILALGLFSFAFAAQAKSLVCEIRINDEVLTVEGLQTELGKKATVGIINAANASVTTAYITETEPDYFVLEATVSPMEIQLHTEGRMQFIQDKLIASFMSRDLAVGIQCFQNSFQ